MEILFSFPVDLSGPGYQPLPLPLASGLSTGFPTAFSVRNPNGVSTAGNTLSLTLSDGTISTGFYPISVSAALSGNTDAATVNPSPLNTWPRNATSGSVVLGTIEPTSGVLWVDVLGYRI